MKTITLLLITNGEETKTRAKLEENLLAVLKRVLKKTKNLSRPAADWEIREANGVILENNRLIKEFGFKAGVRLFFSLKIGAGGNGSYRRTLGSTRTQEWVCHSRTSYGAGKILQRSA